MISSILNGTIIESHQFTDTPISDWNAQHSAQPTGNWLHSIAIAFFVSLESGRNKFQPKWNWNRIGSTLLLSFGFYCNIYKFKYAILRGSNFIEEKNEYKVKQVKLFHQHSHSMYNIFEQIKRKCWICEQTIFFGRFWKDTRCATLYTHSCRVELSKRSL